MTCDKVPASDLVRFARQAAAQGTGRYYEYGIAAFSRYTRKRSRNSAERSCSRRV
jgi:hypothetical protein